MKVLVLLSAYNGEKYIREQLNSVLAQRGCDVYILVRDDGSTDDTALILKSYSREYGEKVRYFSGDNIGVCDSFFELILRADKEYEAKYFALCDQDDFWQNDKLISAIKFLENSSKAAMYFSDQIITDENLRPIGKTDYKPRLTLGSAMAKNSACGCTIVINKKFLRLLTRSCPKEASIHDTWIYRTAAAVGCDIYFDKNPHMLYRQHSKNVIGERKSSFKRLKYYAASLFKKQFFSRTTEAGLLIKYYGNIMSCENRELLLSIANYRKSLKIRFKLAFDKRLRTGDFLTDLVVWAAVILGVF